MKEKRQRGEGRRGGQPPIEIVLTGVPPLGRLPVDFSFSFPPCVSYFFSFVLLFL